MIELIWDDRFKKIYKKWCRQHPELMIQFTKKIVLFETDPFHPSLKTHTLSGVLKGLCRFGSPTNIVSSLISLMKNTHKQF